MQKGSILIPIDPETFWAKLREIVEQVMNDRDRKTRQSGNEGTPQLLKVKEVCELFQISKPTIYDWIRKGQLHSVKIESRRFFLESDIEEMITNHRMSNRNEKAE